MRDNPYKDLPPLERRPDGSLYLSGRTATESKMEGTHER